MPHKTLLTKELSYQFFPEAWGQGFTSEACQTVIQDVEKGCRLVAETQSANAPSTQLLNRLGFVPIDHFVRFNAPQTLYERVR